MNFPLQPYGELQGPLLFQFESLFSDLEGTVHVLKRDFQYPWLPDLLTVIIVDCINCRSNSWKVFGNQFGITGVHELSPLIVPEQRNNQ